MIFYTPLFRTALLAPLLIACDGADNTAPSETAAPAAAEAPKTSEDIQAQEVFREAARETGLNFTHFLGSTGNYYFPEMTGSGVAVLDYDGDGDLDVYLPQGAMLEDKPPEASIFPPPTEHWPGNRLFRNELSETGELRFTDVTGQAGVGHQGYGIGAAVGDIDNDGDPDLYLTNFGSNVLYRNNGDGTFTDITEAAGADDPRWSTSAAFFDYDRDGDLDLYVANYVNYTLQSHQRCAGSTGRQEYCSPQRYQPAPDRLLRNDGGARFTDVSAEAGLGAAFGPGLGVTIADYNNDGWPDIYVANDGAANQLWINRQDGSFEDTALMAGSAYNADGVPEASMGVTAGDFDGDGDEDLFMTHLRDETNTLYVNDGRGNFLDQTAQLNLGHGSMPFTGFGSEWFDYDNDSDLDLFIANGAVSADPDQIGKVPHPYLQENQLFRNEGGSRFTDISHRAGAAMRLRESSRGAAFGDIDNDGDVDIVVSNNNGPVRLLLNEVGNQKHWLLVKLEGTRSNRDAIGARVVLLLDGKSALWRRVHTDGSYASANDVRVHFGLGDEAGAVAVGVRWPDGRDEIWRGIQSDTQILLKQGGGEPWEISRQ